MSGRSRRIVAGLCGAVGILLIFAAVLLGYLTRSLFNEQAFSSRVAASLKDPDFANYVSERITDAVIKAKPDLVGLRPVLVGIGRGVVASPPFRAAVRRSARAAHHAIMSGAGTEIVLSVQDLGVVMASMAESHPALANKIPPKVSAVIGEIGSLPGGQRALRLVQIARRLRVAAVGFLLLGIALCVAGVSLSGERRMAILRTGVGLALLGLALAILARFGGFGVGLLARHAENSPPLGALARAFLGGLLPWAIGLGCAGLVLASASASFLERIPLGRWSDGLRGWMTAPEERMRVRLARGLVGASLGAALLIAPLASLTVAVWLAGLVAAFAGLREAFVAALHVLPEIEAGKLQHARRRVTHRGAIALAGGLALVLLAGITWWIVRANANAPEEEVVTACNGSSDLCDRRLDQVVFPTSHNSMSGANVPGWMIPNQNADIRHQLADCVRGFLIDAHYGVPIGDRVRTDLGEEVNSMAKYEEVVGKEGVDAALRIRGRLSGEPTGERDVYMCHGFCELGALS
jgi:hypothetical protein